MMFAKQKLVRNLWLVLILWAAFLLRVYHLQSIPNGLFIDEAARGYDAFAIARTGADMFGEFLPLFPRGFDDYTPGLYTYLTVPFVYFLDLSRFSTRYAAVWIGVFTVAVAYLVIRTAFGRAAGLAGAALLAISPWYVLLSRIGTEWTLLGLGPVLAIVVLYRGLQRPAWLAAGGAVAGLSLYGYAPVKAFLPLLLAAFGLFYWRPLWRQRRALLAAGLILALLAYPVYRFSLTPEGQIRLAEIYYFDKLPLQESLYLFVANYLAYLSPGFLFRPASDQVFVQSLRDVGLLYGFELPLIVVGIILVFKTGRREQYFWLAWLLLAPLGINLHIQSPKPALWLTATPALHGLAGAGLAYVMGLARRSPGLSQPGRIDRRQSIALILLAGLAVVAGWNIRTMVQDLFHEFPVYSISTEQNWWAYDLERAMADVRQLAPAFDSVILQPFELEAISYVSGIYFAFYDRFPPHQRQAEVLRYGEAAWQQVGPVAVGQLEARLRQPGCHLAVMTPKNYYSLPLPKHLLKTYNLPDRPANPPVLAAAAGALPEWQPAQVVFGEQILLERFALVSNPATDGSVIEPGQALCLVLSWQSAGNLVADYTVFVHLVQPNSDSPGPPLAQHDGMPVDGLRPTRSWQPGERIEEMRVMVVPADAPKGRYHLNIGWYDPATGARLPARNQADQVRLVELQVR